MHLPSSDMYLASVDNPSVEPTAEPTAEPTTEPTAEPTWMPTSTQTDPTLPPTWAITSLPSSLPTASPTNSTATPSRSPTIKPTAPTNVPTLAPTGPTRMPTAGPEFMSYDVSLSLKNATSNVLDATATLILQASVANASHVMPSDVILTSYVATATSAVAGHSASRATPQGQDNTQLSLFSSETDPTAVFRSLRMSALATPSYTIRANLAIRVALADYPQFGSNITALYVSLTSNLIQAVNDNSLSNTIRVLSVEANSLTFMYVDNLEVLEISAPLAEGSPTAMPTSGPRRDNGARFNAGEIAGIIIAVMVGIALLVTCLYFACTYKTPDRSAAYLYVEPGSQQFASRGEVAL